MAVWKKIDDTNYEISNCGLVRNHITGRIIKDATSKSLKGYRCVSLFIDGKRRTKLVHRLVANYFIRPLTHKEQVNHIDMNKSNNNLSNLEIVNNRQNITHKNILNTELTSKFTGVSLHKSTNKWLSCIRIGKKSIHLGLFDSEELASKMYNISLTNIDKYDGDNKKFRSICLPDLRF